MPSDLRQRLDRARRELLDLSTRNRLLSIPVASQSARVIHIADELSTEVFRLLVTDRKTASFLPGRKSAPAARKPTDAAAEAPASEAGDEPERDEAGLPPPDETEDEKTGLARRHVDSRLQTTLTPEGLQRRLLDLFQDARTTIEETGVNVLYVALGQLKWFEAEDAATPRYAPLVLVPVDLLRKSAADRFFLKAREEDVEENLSLRAKLQADFQLELPGFPDPEVLELPGYFAEVAKAITGESKWEVLPNAMALGFFSFAKFLMYRDLDADSWPDGKSLLQNRFVSALLGEGFPTAEPPIPDHTQLDELIPVERLDHVVDADGSQSLAIEMVRQGRSLVIQGPPGTGKSQSIANIIATAVLDGKKVLFVAEKLAALEVVKRRLEREGLGDMCLELHSNKASKRGVLAEIGRTWRLGKPREGGLQSVLAQLEARRSTLNDHSTGLHTVHTATGLTPFRVLGELVRLGEPEHGAHLVELPGAETWDAEGRARREQVVVDLAERIRQIGLPGVHPWRGVQRETVLKIDLPALLARMPDTAQKLTTVQVNGRQLAQLLGVAEPLDLATASWLALLAEHVSKAPPLDRQALCAGVWNAGLEGLSDLVAAGRRFAGATQKVGAQVTEAAWDKDFEKLRAVFAAHGRSLFRIFNGEYRGAMAELRGVRKGELPAGFEARLALVDELVAGQKALRGIRAEEAQAVAAFGSAWRKERSDWAQLEQVLAWVKAQRAVGLGEEFRRMFAGVQQPANAGALGVKLAGEVRSAQDALTRLAEELKLDPQAAFGVDALDKIPFVDFLTRVAVWREQPEELSRWSNYFTRVGQGRELGLTPLVEALASGALAPDAARLAFRRACYGQILREFCRLNPGLARFDGDIHSRQVEEFRQLDRDRLTLAKYRVLAAHHAEMPGMNAGVGAVGIVNSELERKRGHRPVRQLLRDAGSVIQAVKPVFMMSPLSVAQFLAPGAVEFDLLVVDEASQVQPVDALGAVARCQQIVVVGDSKQLPPTRFFAHITSDEPAAADDESGAAPLQEIESILGLCSARGLPQSMLRWHYRSRHHSLIAVSNHEFYEDRLFIVPSPYAASTEQGLHFRHVPEGVFDSGGTGNNRVEAKTVGRAVLEHARAHPGLSLGVAAFSVRQQQAILDELELLRRENPDTEAFFAGHPNEPFFVKNLENVQGDERDVIFISIGYGRDLNGQLAMRFGPLSNDGGERRLNVLISRAKKRCEVFSSILADDIDLARASGRGVKSLKAFLQFAQTGRLVTTTRDGQEEDSPFEQTLRAALEAEGYEVHARVGVAGFFVDLAVVDRERAGRYVLGIECDGAAYHASRSARDRDRLRQAVLEDHGWILHRVWSTDWFQRPTEQLRRTAAAIERARVAVDEAIQQETARREAAAAEIVREEQEEAEATGTSVATEPYQVAAFAPPRRKEPHALSPGEMADLLYQIVETEGPVHEDELVVRVKDLWGLQRVGTRIQDAVTKGIQSLVDSQRCVREDDCFDLPDRPVRVRNRETAASPGLKRPNLLPPSEIRASILSLIDVAHGASRRELPTAIARTLGFKTTTVPLREAVERQIQKLEEQGEVGEQNGLLQRGAVPPTPEGTTAK